MTIGNAARWGSVIGCVAAGFVVTLPILLLVRAVSLRWKGEH